MNNNKQRNSQPQPKGKQTDKKPVFLNFGLASPKQPPVKEGDFIEEVIERRLEQNPSIEYIGLGGVGYKANEWLDRFTAATQKSPTYEAARKAKIEYAFKDFAYSDEAAKNSNQPKFETVSPRGHSLFDVCRNAANQFEIYGNVFIEIMRINGQTFIDTLNIYQCRPVKNLILGYADKVAVSARFENLDYVSPQGLIPEKDVQIIPLYPNFGTVSTAGGEVEKSIIHIKNDAPAFNYWGLPTWLPAYDYMLLQYYQARYNRSEFENGFRSSGFFEIGQDASNAEINDVVNQIRKATGVGENGHAFITNVALKFTPTGQVQEGHYTKLDIITTNKILETCNMPPALAGIKTAGSLGSNQQLENEFEAFQNVAVKPLQRVIFERILKPYQLLLGFQLNNLPITGLIGSSPITARSQINAALILTINEQRQLMGFQPLSDPSANQLPNSQNLTIQ